MRSLPSILAAIFLVAVLLFYACTFQVRSTEVAIVKTFGQAQREPIKVAESDQSFFAGLRFKWPWPIQSVAKYDTRIRLLEDRIEESPTRDGKQIVLTTFTGWTISDPYKFHTQYQTIDAGESALRKRLRTYKKEIIGLHSFADFVSLDPEERKLDKIENEMLTAVRTEAADEFGIEIRTFGIKQFTVPETVTEAVFKTMKAEQMQKAMRYKSEGQAEAEKILAEAKQATSRIGAVVSRKASEIQAEGQERVSQIYAQFQEHEELKIFLDSLAAVEDIMRFRTTIFMSTETPPMHVLSAQNRVADPDEIVKALEGQVMGDSLGPIASDNKE